ncbi:DMT family transporter [Allorhizocola rhizosphaerae]|uniref:DMT family transporter n=1 Tax=Allorhizocola rhizosphaerae TaxID=1872709 RepID=UPI000E3D89D9|nr:DMT family transporter [Allorhizocola rhizosphaerae]
MSRRAWLMFAAVSVLWGFPYLFIKIAVFELSPPVIVVGRTAIAAAILLPLAIRSGALRALRGRVGTVVVLSLTHICGPFLLITYGEVYISSSLTALLLATQPLMIAALALRFDVSERITRGRLVSLGIGLTGVAAVVGFDLGSDHFGLLGAGYVLLATLGYAGSTLIVKRKLAGVPSLGLTTATVTLTTLFLAPFAIATAPTQLPSLKAVSSVVILGVFSTAVALLLFYRLIATIGAGRAALVSYVNPAVAVVLGVIVLHEPLTSTTLLGFALILIGSFLSTTNPWRSKAVKIADVPSPGEETSHSDDAAAASLAGEQRGRG